MLFGLLRDDNAEKGIDFILLMTKYHIKSPMGNLNLLPVLERSSSTFTQSSILLALKQSERHLLALIFYSNYCIFCSMYPLALFNLVLVKVLLSLQVLYYLYLPRLF